MAGRKAKKKLWLVTIEVVDLPKGHERLKTRGEIKSDLEWVLTMLDRGTRAKNIEVSELEAAL